MEMVGEVHGLRVLDLGCGEGGYGRELARRGARVVGVDGSARLIEIARERAAKSNVEIELICANANALDELTDNSFDLVIAPMSLMDVEDYDGAVQEIHRVLVDGGTLVLSITHPCFTAPLSEWERDPDDSHKLLHFKVDRYFHRSAWPEHITSQFAVPVLRRHRPLEDYMQGLLRHDFRLRDFQEPVPKIDELGKSKRFERITRIPYFLFMRWEKAIS